MAAFAEFAPYSFKLKNPRKGTETPNSLLPDRKTVCFQIKESPEGDWNEKKGRRSRKKTKKHFQIKESPEGDWNLSDMSAELGRSPFQIKESPEGDWNSITGPSPTGPSPLSN